MRATSSLISSSLWYCSISLLLFLPHQKTTLVVADVFRFPSSSSPAAGRSSNELYQDEGVATTTRNDYNNGNATDLNLGHPSCPCLSKEELSNYNIIEWKDGVDPDPQIRLIIDTATSKSDTYGLYCGPHDLNTPRCNNIDHCTTLVPLPVDCDKSFCQRSFCFVDPRNCNLHNKPSHIYQGLHYSYATCGYMDSFTYMERRKHLQGQTLKVALNSNTGGWMGAYNPEGSFAMNQLWTGPMVEFIKDAARRGGFQLDITTPPEFLRNESKRFFGDSSFDYCVYATSLGYLDLCIAAYTITDKRASVTPFFELGSDPVYLVIFTDDETGTSWQETFTKSLMTIFQPFTSGSWIMIVCVCLPVLGLLMLFHEYGSNGSAFPAEEDIVRTDIHTGEQTVESHKISAREHIPKALYMSYLSFFNGSYDLVVLSMGGKIHLLAILSFVLLVLAVYTANLAAILTQDASKSPIDSLPEAIKADYNFCASRKVATRIIDLYNVEPERIVADPPHLGGDGKPGFNCPNCGARERIFDFMINDRRRDRNLYCNAALASYEDLQVLHQYRMHCNKTTVGDMLTIRDFGIPITSSQSDVIMSWFYEMKYQGVMDTHLRVALPQSQCPDNEGEEGIALNVEQLTGIWTVVFGFATLGLLATILNPFFDKRKHKWAERRLARHDQWSNHVEVPITENELDNISKNVDRVRMMDELEGTHRTVVSNDNISASDRGRSHFARVTKFPTKGMTVYHRSNSKGSEFFKSCRSGDGSTTNGDPYVLEDLELDVQ